MIQRVIFQKRKQHGRAGSAVLVWYAALLTVGTCQVGGGITEEYGAQSQYILVLSIPTETEKIPALLTCAPKDE